jgi:hypothetical protein|eukprot:4738062-Prymnesium_polylepis.2
MAMGPLAGLLHDHQLDYLLAVLSGCMLLLLPALLHRYPLGWAELPSPPANDKKATTPTPVCTLPLLLFLMALTVVGMGSAFSWGDSNHPSATSCAAISPRAFCVA